MPLTGKLRRHFARSVLAARGFRGERSGMAAVEFALIVPIMIMMFIGAFEFSQALTVDRRVTNIASATADLVAQTDKIACSELSDIMRIIDSLMAPYPTSRLDVTIVSAITDSNSVPKVDWSYKKGGSTPYATGSSYALPVGLAGPNESVVIAEVTNKYDPPVSKYLIGDINFSEKFYLRPRKSLKVDKLC